VSRAATVARRCRARPSPRTPSPRSTTTVIAPTVQHAYAAAMKSGGSGASTATRSPEATPALRIPVTSSATRSASEAKESVLPPPTATAVAWSSSRRTSAAHGASGVGPAGAGTGSAGSSRLLIHASARAETSSSSTTRCPARGKRCRPAWGRRRRRSVANSRWKTGSRSPHARRTGASISDRRAATSASGA
jgi:hypothetical protein